MSPDALSPAKRALLERALRERRAAAAEPVRIPRRAGGDPAPLSYAQQRMWFLAQWEPQAPTFNGARAFELHGELDRGALESGFARVLSRHESLRTVVMAGTQPRQRVLGEDEYAFAMAVHEAPGDAGALTGALRELAREPFDLERDLMLRVDVFALGPERHVLLVRMHHIAADAHSDRVMFGELAECYAAYVSGREPVLPELAIQYSDYAVWQRERLEGARMRELSQWWAAALDGAPPRLRLPTDRPRLPVQRHDGAHHPLALPRELATALLEHGRAQGATFFMTMLAAYATLLYRLSGQEDIVIGSPIANRDHLELAGMIGFLTNTIALRVSLGGNPSFRQAIARARAAALGAYAHQELPFEKVVEAVAPPRDAGYNPIFQANFRAQEAPRPELSLAGLRSRPIPVDIGFARFDCALELELRPDALAGYFEYDRDLFDPDSVRGWETDLRALLSQTAADPDLPILAARLDSRRRAGPSGPGIARRRRA